MRTVAAVLFTVLFGAIAWQQYTIHQMQRQNMALHEITVLAGEAQYVRFLSKLERLYAQ